MLETALRQSKTTDLNICDQIVLFNEFVPGLQIGLIDAFANQSVFERFLKVIMRYTTVFLCTGQS